VRGIQTDRHPISRQMLSQWVVRIGLALKPLYDLMLRKIIKSENVFIEESPISMLRPGNGKVHQAFMWVLAGGKERDPPNRVYLFKTDRKHEHALNLLGNYSGTLHSDKYGAYEKLAAEGSENPRQANLRNVRICTWHVMRCRGEHTCSSIEETVIVLERRGMGHRFAHSTTHRG
jgi:hypothetical protein